MLNHILMTVMQLMLRQIQHQVMRNSMIFTSLSRLFHLVTSSMTEQEAVHHSVQQRQPSP